jgi:uncharacterized RDD family membrane protein YckC
MRPVPFAPLKKRIASFAADFAIAGGAMAVSICLPGFPEIGSQAFVLMLAGSFALLQIAGMVNPDLAVGRVLQGIFVLSARSGGRPSLSQAILRPLARVVWALFGVALAEVADQNALVLLPLLVDLALIAHHPRRQATADLLAGTVVVVSPPYQPHRAPALPMYSASDSEFGSPPKQ